MGKDSYLNAFSRADWVDVGLAPREHWLRLAEGVHCSRRRESPEMVEFETAVRRMAGVPWGIQGRELYSQTLIEVKRGD